MDKTSGVFSSGEWEFDACLNFSPNQEIGYIDGYRKAANILVNYVEKERKEQDYLVYPIFYLYRHHLELRIKNLIEKGCKLLDLPYEKEKYANHNIKKLWNGCKSILKEINPCEENFEKMEIVVNNLYQIDSSSFSFRYPTDKKGHSSLDSKIKTINIKVLASHLNETFNLLEGANEEITRLADSKSELIVNM